MSMGEIFFYGMAVFTVGWFFALLMTLLLDLGYALIEMVGDVFWH